MIDVCIIGAGPAGLMAASQVANSGLSVMVVDAKPSVGRKFLMAGKSGLNLTKDEPHETFCSRFEESEPWLRPMLDAFGTEDVIQWADAFDQQVFTGSSGRIFPKAMKASPLLRAWLKQLQAANVQFKTRWRWTGWNDDCLIFDTPDGAERIQARATILALGGASWRALGSDGEWAGLLKNRDITLAPFQPANVGFKVDWSNFMVPHFGQPIKSVRLLAGDKSVQGDFVISKRGLEGSAIYGVSKAMREGAVLTVDLLPDVSLKVLRDRLANQKGKASRANIIRKTLRMNPSKTALFNEFSNRCDPNDIPAMAKSLPITHSGPRPIDEAISTAGGVPRGELNEDLMLTKLPSVFCAGEMLDWDAPTGGYLITACLATGRWAGLGAVDYLASN